jgi:hypothetical protein
MDDIVAEKPLAGTQSISPLYIPEDIAFQWQPVIEALRVTVSLPKSFPWVIAPLSSRRSRSKLNNSVKSQEAYASTSFGF